MDTDEFIRIRLKHGATIYLDPEKYEYDAVRDACFPALVVNRAGLNAGDEVLEFVNADGSDSSFRVSEVSAVLSQAQ